MYRTNKPKKGKYKIDYAFIIETMSREIDYVCNQPIGERKEAVNESKI